MPLHVLLIQGMSIVNSDWYADQLLASSSYLRRPTCIVTRVSYDYGENIEAVQQAMRKHDYNAIIVCDLSEAQDTFSTGIGPVIQRYVRSGGRVAFPTTEGLNLIPVLKELFDVPWTRSSYGREDWIANPQSAALLSAQFPLGNRAQAVNLRFCVKGCSYTNVPQSDRCFEAQPYDDEDDSDEDCGAHAARQESPVLVAIRSYGDGFVSYFGDVNCEPPTAQLIGAFVTVPRKRPPCSWDTERNVRRATQARENGNKAFREGQFQHALSFYSAAQKHLEPVANRCKEECSKVLGNIAECRLKLNQWPDAIEASTKALELDPSNFKAHYRRTRAYLMAARGDVDVLKKHGDVHASAVSHIHDLAVKLSKHTRPESEMQEEMNGSSSVTRDIGLLSKTSSELREIGNEKFKAKMYDFAMSYYEAALMVGPSNDSDHVKILCNLSLCHIRKEDWDLAAKAANDALEINPNAEKALLRRAKAYIRKGNLKDAKADLKRLESLPDGSGKEFRSLSEELRNAMGNADEQESDSESAGPLYATTGTISGPPFAANMSPPFTMNMQRVSGVPAAVDRPPNSWSNGLERSKRYEWLVDCYRMRIDDEYSYMGDVRSGSIYDPDHSADSIMVDFLIFCKLAVAKGALPSEWDWREFLNTAVNHLQYAFEKSDAREKYGNENYFHGLLFENGRSLRFTAKKIYGTDIQIPDDCDEQYDDMLDMVMSRIFEDCEYVDFQGSRSLLADVGSTRVWRDFLHQLQARV